MAPSDLFTTFTPPPDCLSNTYRYGGNQLVGPMTSSCYPSGWTNTSTTYYSPAACPLGYTTGCITANTAGSVTETVATCCPSDFICQSSDNTLGCRSTIIGGKPQLMTVMDADFVSPSTTVTQTIGGNVNAYGVQIRFQATDLVRSTTTDSTSTPPSSIAPRPTSSALIPTATSSSSLSTGTKAGIGVGAALAGLVFLVALFLGWQYVKNRWSALEGQQGGEVRGGGTKSKSHSEVKSGGLYEAQSEMKYNGPYEAGTQEVRGELPEQNEMRRPELYGEGR